MFKNDRTLERQLFAYSPRDMIPEDSDVYLYNELFDQLNIEDFYLDYSTQGQDSVDPRLMLRTVFYGLTHGVATGRKLYNACCFDNRYMVLAGGHQPSYRTFSRFLKRHDQRIEGLFIEIVRLAQTLGLVSLGMVAIDGTRIKAKTSRHRTLKAEKFDRAIEHIKEELKSLREDLEKKSQSDASDAKDSKIPKAIANKEHRIEQIKKAKARLDQEAKQKDEETKGTTQVSLNDPDARSLGSRKEQFLIGYNFQAAADSKHQIILAAEICDNTNDSKGYTEVLGALIENCKEKPEAILADAGYVSIPNLEATTSQGIEPIISMQKIEEKKRLKDLTPTEDGKGYYCKSRLRLKSTKVVRKDFNQLKIVIPTDNCVDCPLSENCMIFKSGKKSLVVLAHREREIMLSQLSRMESEDFQEKYKRRKAIVEPVFANIKSSKRFVLNQIGRKVALAWWRLVCTALNIEKIIGFQMNQIRLVSP